MSNFTPISGAIGGALFGVPGDKDPCSFDGTDA